MEPQAQLYRKVGTACIEAFQDCKSRCGKAITGAGEEALVSVDHDKVFIVNSFVEQRERIQRFFVFMR
jgi:hypothetical protein